MKGKWPLAALLVGLSVVIWAPVWIAVTGTFSAQWELEQALAPVFSGGNGYAQWSLLPQAPSARGMLQVLLDSPGFFTMFWNSVWITGWVLLGQLLAAVPAAWALAQLPLPGRKGLLRLYLVMMLMPFQTLMLPQYLVLNRLGLLDSFPAVILPGVFSAFPVFVLYRFFLAVDRQILEAARLDGAGEWRIFFRMGLPIGAPGVLAVGVLSFLEMWNAIEQPMTYLKTQSRWPLSLFLPEIGPKELAVGFSAAFLMLVPAMLLFASCQEGLEQGIALSGGKEGSC